LFDNIFNFRVIFHNLLVQYFGFFSQDASTI